MSAASFTLPASLLLAGGVCLLDDAMVLIVVGVAGVAALLALGATRLMAAAERWAGGRATPQ